MTLLKQLKEAWIFRSYRQRFPQAHFAPGARLGGTTTLEGIVRLGRQALVQHSRVRSGCVVGDEAWLRNTTLGTGCWIGPQCRLIDVSMGDGTYLAEGGRLDLCTIGKYCSLGPQLLAGFGEHPTDRLSTHPAFYATRDEHPLGLCQESSFVGRRRIVVGNDVWIGARAFLRDGVVIGDGAIVAAGAVVVKDVPPYAVVGGVPARLLRRRVPPAMAEALLRIRWWEWPRELVVRRLELLGSTRLAEFVRLYDSTLLAGHG